MRLIIGLFIILTILGSGCANSAGIVKAQHQRTALGVKETPWGQLPTYSYTIPLRQTPLRAEIFEDAKMETHVALDLLINADGTVADARVATTGDKAAAEAVRQNFLTARYAPNRDAGVSRFVTQLTFSLTPSLRGPTSAGIPYGGK